MIPNTMDGAMGSEYTLRMRQEPDRACVCIGKGKGTDRKPVDPPPIVELERMASRDPTKRYLQSPYLLLMARLVRKDYPESGSVSPDQKQPAQDPKDNDLSGNLVSSLYSLKDNNDNQAGFFVFGDLSVRKEGVFRLEFNLYDMDMENKAAYLKARCYSNPFTVYAAKSFPGMSESTFLTRSFSDQGVRLRLRKDSNKNAKRTHSMANKGGENMSNIPSTGALDRSGSSMGSNGYTAYPTVDHSYPHYYYNDRAAKRMRTSSMEAAHGLYEHSYYPAIPRLDTQVPPAHTAPPTSTSSTFSPGTRQSPGSSYQYHAQTPIYASQPTVSYQSPAVTMGGPQVNGVGLGMSSSALGAVKAEDHGALAQTM